jgi:hypothetical protein
MYGYPNEKGTDARDAGLAVFGGCVVQPGMADYACPRRHGWRGDGGLPDGADPAARLYAAGDLDGAAAAYAEAVAASVEARGERDQETQVLRHALTLVLTAAGRTEEASAAFAPVRAQNRERTIAKIERYARLAEERAARDKR